MQTLRGGESATLINVFRYARQGFRHRCGHGFGGSGIGGLDWRHAGGTGESGSRDWFFAYTKGTQQRCAGVVLWQTDEVQVNDRGQNSSQFTGRDSNRNKLLLLALRIL